MLLEFSVENFLSIKDRLTLPLEAAAISDYPENSFSTGKNRLLKSAVIYGANNSGKSNLLEAMGTFRHIVRNSGKMSSTDLFDEITPYLLSKETENAPSLFEILFFIDEYRYRYGYEISKEQVHTEWLFRTKAQTEKMLFVRDGDKIEVSKYYVEGEKLESKTRPNALFLSVVDQFNGEITKKIMKWFEQFNTISGLEHENYRNVTYDMLNNLQHQQYLSTFLSKLDLGFEEIEVKEQEFDLTLLPPNMPEDMRKEVVKRFKGEKTLELYTIHDMYDAEGSLVERRKFNMDTQESSGTNKLFDLLGPVFHTLQNGQILVIDELNAKLHPLLTKAIVGLFNSEENNPLNAQLIFATHDTNLLSYGHFRRDQIYFVEKNQWGATDLYSLLEYKEDGETIRKDRSFEKDYIQGRYGAIPFLGDLGELFATWREKQKSIMQS